MSLDWYTRRTLSSETAPCPGCQAPSKPGLGTQLSLGRAVLGRGRWLSLPWEKGKREHKKEAASRAVESQVPGTREVAVGTAGARLLRSRGQIRGHTRRALAGLRGEPAGRLGPVPNHTAPGFRLPCAAGLAPLAPRSCSSVGHRGGDVVRGGRWAERRGGCSEGARLLLGAALRTPLLLSLREESLFHDVLERRAAGETAPGMWRG